LPTGLFWHSAEQRLRLGPLFADHFRQYSCGPHPVLPPAYGLPDLSPPPPREAPRWEDG